MFFNDGRFYSLVSVLTVPSYSLSQRFTIKRGITGDDDVEFAIKYCGVCHSDVHMGYDDLGLNMSPFPLVPGHELAGIVTKVKLIVC